MARAELLYALALDRDIWQASQVDISLLDPLVRVASLPGTARPVAVVRDYQGPSGHYLEHFTITDGRGRVLHTEPRTTVILRGQQFADRRTTVLPALDLDRGDEHTLRFYVDDELVGEVPMFVEVGAGGDPSVALAETFRKALGKGAIVWLVVPPQPSTNGHRRRGRKPKLMQRGLQHAEQHQPVWYVLQGDKVYVFNGPTEQTVPGLDTATDVDIVARSKDLRSRVVRVPASVRRIPVEDPLFDQIGQAGLGRRLNLPDGEGALERWRANCALLELTPRFEEVTGRGGTVAGGGAAAAGPAGSAQAAAPGAAAAPAAGAPGGGAAGAAKPAEEDIHVEAQIDQEVFDELVAEGKSERVARAKAKAAYVRKEKARIRAERETAEA